MGILRRSIRFKHERTRLDQIANTLTLDGGPRSPN